MLAKFSLGDWLLLFIYFFYAYWLKEDLAAKKVRSAEAEIALFQVSLAVRSENRSCPWPSSSGALGLWPRGLSSALKPMAITQREERLYHLYTEFEYIFQGKILA